MKLVKTAWSQLHNANHIDWVLESLNNNPDLWVEVKQLDIDYLARLESWSTALEANRLDVRDVVYDMSNNMGWGAAWDAAWGAISALIAYDDCDKYLNMSYEQVKMWAILSSDPGAVLLTPMVYVKEKTHECMATTA